MSRQESVSLTRDEFYELVWSKPMTKIAADFGVSSAALRGQLASLDVPWPWSGYWTQIAVGKQVTSTPLPAAGPSTPRSVVFDRNASTPLIERRPPVPIAKALVRPHAAVTLLREQLVASPYGVRGDGHSVLRVAPKTERRTWLLLDALFKAFSARGHALRLRRGRKEDSFVLELVVDGEHPAELWLLEHVSGRLILETDLPWGVHLRRRWADGTKQRLEDVLGDVVVGLEGVALAWRADRERRDQERKEQEAERQRREDAARRAARRRAREAELLKTARDWREAAVLREFLVAAKAALAGVPQPEAFAAWLVWATSCADRLDPLGTPEATMKLAATFDEP